MNGKARLEKLLNALLDCPCSKVDSAHRTNICECLQSAASLSTDSSETEIKPVVDCLMKAAEWLLSHVPADGPQRRLFKGQVPQAAMSRLRLLAKIPDLESVADLAEFVSWLCEDVPIQEIGPIIYDPPVQAGPKLGI
jgi:hypothetical protein